MKPERALVAERIAAQHCAELLRYGPSPAELLPMLEKSGHQLARLFGPALAPLLGSKPAAVSAKPARLCAMAELAQDIAPLAANTMLSIGSQDIPAFASIDAAAVLRIVDRAFGGPGEVPASLPEAFPFSAELMIGRLEALVVSQVALSLGLEEGSVRATRRDGSLEQLAPFPADCRIALVELEVTEQNGERIGIRFALRQQDLPELFPVRRANARVSSRPPANPANEPFADVPLRLRAVLVDMPVSMSTIAALEPGQVLPVAVARNVPLRVGDKTIAHGAVGAIDDRIAVQITKAF